MKIANSKIIAKSPCHERRKREVNVFRRCLDCGHEYFEPEIVHINEYGGNACDGFTECPKCRNGQFALLGFTDRRLPARRMRNASQEK